MTWHFLLSGNILYDIVENIKLEVKLKALIPDYMDILPLSTGLYHPADYPVFV